jgi:hypothetical protein
MVVALLLLLDRNQSKLIGNSLKLKYILQKKMGQKQELWQITIILIKKAVMETWSILESLLIPKSLKMLRTKHI